MDGVKGATKGLQSNINKRMYGMCTRVQLEEDTILYTYVLSGRDGVIDIAQGELMITGVVKGEKGHGAISSDPDEDRWIVLNKKIHEGGRSELFALPWQTNRLIEPVHDLAKVEVGLGDIDAQGVSRGEIVPPGGLNGNWGHGRRIWAEKRWRVRRPITVLNGGGSAPENM